MVIKVKETFVFLFFCSFCMMAIDSFTYFPTSSTYRPIAFVPLLAAFLIYVTKMKLRPFFVFSFFISVIAIFHSVLMSVILSFPSDHIGKMLVTVTLFFIMISVFNKVIYINRYDLDYFLSSLGKLSFYVLIVMFIIGFIQLFFPSTISEVVTGFFSYRSNNRLQMLSGEPSMMVRNLLFYLLFFVFFYCGHQKTLMLTIGGAFLLASGSAFGYVAILLAIALYILLFKPLLIFSIQKIFLFLFLSSLFYYLYLNYLDAYTVNKIDRILNLVTSGKGSFISFSAFIEADGSAFMRTINPVIGFMSGKSSWYAGVGLDAYRYIYPHYILEYFPHAMNFHSVASGVNGSSYITSKSLYSRIYAEMGGVTFIVFIGYLTALYYNILKLKGHRYYRFLTVAYVLALVLVIQGDSIIYLNFFFLLTLIHIIVFQSKQGNI